MTLIISFTVLNDSSKVFPIGERITAIVIVDIILFFLITLWYLIRHKIFKNVGNEKG